jgi:hypothetical protein
LAAEEKLKIAMPQGLSASLQAKTQVGSGLAAFVGPVAT